jgi:predicted ATPase
MEILAVTLMGAFDKSTPLGGQQGAVFGCDYRPTEILRCSLPTPMQVGTWGQQQSREVLGGLVAVPLLAGLAWAAGLHQHRREGPLAQERAEACITLATGYGSVAYVMQGTIMRGWALVAQGQSKEGIAHLRQGLAARWAAGSLVGWSYYLSLLAEVYANIGQTAEGLSAIDEVLAFVHTTGERFWEAEVYRLQGELLSLGKEEQERGKVEECCRQALEIARCQQAKSLELRAAMSLSRLWQQQGKRTEGRALLAPIYGWFTEGFDTADLQDARALLDALR